MLKGKSDFITFYAISNFKINVAFIFIILELRGDILVIKKKQKHFLIFKLLNVLGALEKNFKKDVTIIILAKIQLSNLD